MNKIFFRIYACLAVVFAWGVNPVLADGSATVSLTDSSSGGVHTISVLVDPNGAKICSLFSRYSFDKNMLSIESIEVGNSAFQNANSDFFELSRINADSSITANIGFPGCQVGAFEALRFTAVARDLRGVNTITADSLSVMGGSDGMQPVALTSTNPTISFVTANDPAVPVASQSPSATINNPKTSSPSSGSNSQSNEQTTSTDSEIVSDVSSSKTLSAPSLKTVIYSNNTLFDVNKKRVKGISFAGVADPGSSIVLAIDEDQLADLITTDKSGNWSLFYQSWLGDGDHNISMQAELSGEKSSVARSSFYFDSANREIIGLGTKPVVKLDGSAGEVGIGWLIYLYWLIGVFMASGLGWLIYKYLNRVRVIEDIPLNQKQIIVNQAEGDTQEVGLKPEVIGEELAAQKNPIFTDLKPNKFKHL